METLASTAHLKVKQKLLDGSASRRDVGRVGPASSIHPRFLPFHLQVLKSLYCNDHASSNTPAFDAESTNNNKDLNDDGDSDADKQDSVHPEVWVALEAFMRKRPILIRCKGNAIRCRGIHKQALNFVSSQSLPSNPVLAKNITESKKDKTSSSTTTTTKSLIVTPTTMKRKSSDCASPSLMNLESPAGNDPPAAAVTTKSGSFSVIAKLLGHRAFKIEQTSHERVAKPFTPLLQMTQEHISKLGQIKQKHQKALLEQTQMISSQFLSIHVYAASSQKENVTEKIKEEQLRSDEERSKLAATESKLQLWEILEQEL
eukprot:CAMPEP_0198154084 /NCGR_PEP_ID=MMETSP1443-20131203/67185_1 /TAXON_ID=186043 /ORGANISM="Entomoneis sp., Strain CCMP2396" /LENGTH=315 /DNA_ID=CAMNT_0043820665 /DNA_START=63 /DNA_END=1007 /DNA_ORIENTATION=-